MGILLRYSEIMSQNITALLEKTKSPEKDIKNILQNLELESGKITSELNAKITQEEREKREIEKVKLDIQKMQKYAKTSIERGEESRARKFLEYKIQYIKKYSRLLEKYKETIETNRRLIQMQQKRIKDIEQLIQYGHSLLNRTVLAKAQTKLNRFKSADYKRLEVKVDFMLDEAEALYSLRFQDSIDDEYETLLKEEEKK